MSILKIFHSATIFSLTVGLVALQAQIVPRSSTDEVPLSYADAKMVAVPAGPVPTLLPLQIDPSSSGDDLIDVIIGNPQIRITLLLPNGSEVNAANAAGLGFDFTTLQVSAGGQLEASIFGVAGYHVLVTFPPSQQPGLYNIKADGSALATGSRIVVAYLSSSDVRAGLSTDAAAYRMGDSVNLAGLLLEGSAPIINATAQVTLATPVLLQAQATVANYRLMSQLQIDPSTIQYVYSADLVNQGPTVKTVVANLTSLSDSVSVVAGVLAFGDIAANTTTGSRNTFTIQISNNQSFDPSLLSWDIEGDGQLSTVALQDSGPADFATGDGIYSGTFVPSVAGAYTAVLRATGNSTSGVAFSRTTTTTFRVSQPSANFVANSFTDWSTLTTGTSFISQVTVSADVSVQRAGLYHFTLDLKASNGQIAQATSDVTLSTGLQQASVVIPASELLELGVDGPYERLNALLIFQSWSQSGGGRIHRRRRADRCLHVGFNGSRTTLFHWTEYRYRS